MVCAALPPWGIQTAEAQTAPIFEHVFDGLFNYPTFFYDVNGDGKQEYFLVHHNSDKSPQWCSLSGEMVMAMPNDVGVSPFNWSMLQRFAFSDGQLHRGNMGRYQLRWSHGYALLAERKP